MSRGMGVLILLRASRSKPRDKLRDFASARKRIQIFVPGWTGFGEVGASFPRHSVDHFRFRLEEIAKKIVRRSHGHIQSLKGVGIEVF